MPKKLALLKQKMKKNCIPSAKNKKDLHSQCQIKKNLHSQYQKLKNIVVFEKFGHVTYLQICKFKNLQIYDVLNELDKSSESLFLVKGLILREVCRVTRELAILDQESCQHTEYSDIFPSKKERFVKTLWYPWPTTEQGNSSGPFVYLNVVLGFYFYQNLL